MEHALQRMAEARGGRPGTQQQRRHEGRIDRNARSRSLYSASTVLEEVRNIKSGFHNGVHESYAEIGSSPSRSSTRQRNAAGDMQAEAVGQELRRFGDDFNTLLLLRRVAGGRRHVIRPIRLPRIHQEPTVLFCVGLLLLVIGRMIYWPGG
ncbi:putative bcl-2-like protein 11 [Scophthalmus maximus]|uniref:Putative bcl-2-like protein 11 n=1 Tax=Scophthalmus maximus TaxID=52904 RepID=A0A2U9CFS5_SCOMX|nr:putative bcl-2-like protein 11 [Scophthalmus maximus]